MVKAGLWLSSCSFLKHGKKGRQSTETHTMHVALYFSFKKSRTEKLQRVAGNPSLKTY